MKAYTFTVTEAQLTILLRAAAIAEHAVHRMRSQYISELANVGVVADYIRVAAIAEANPMLGLANAINDAAAVLKNPRRSRRAEKAQASAFNDDSYRETYFFASERLVTVLNTADADAFPHLQVSGYADGGSGYLPEFVHEFVTAFNTHHADTAWGESHDYFDNVDAAVDEFMRSGTIADKPLTLVSKSNP